MSDVQLLFLVLAVIYAWECSFWFPRGFVVVRTWLGNRWHLLHPGVLLGNQGGGVVFAHPIIPLGTLLGAAEFPLQLSPAGVACAQIKDSPLPQTGKFVAWDEISNSKLSEKKILINRELFFQTVSPSLAKKLYQMMLEIKESKVEERNERIGKHLKETFEISRIESRWREFHETTRFLHLATNVLFAYLFVLAPLLLGLFGFRRCWLILLAGVLGLTSLIAILFSRAHKKVFPEAEEERFTHSIIVLLSPATAIRARDVLSRFLFAAYHPLALTKVFCKPERFREQAGIYLRQIRYGAANRQQTRQGRPEASETDRYWRALSQATLEQFLKAHSLEPQQLLQSPSALDESCLSYCPRCLAQFTTREGACYDCGGVLLLPLTRSA